MGSPLMLIGVGTVLLGIIVGFFSRGQGLRIGGVGAALALVGSLDLSNDLLLIVFAAGTAIIVVLALLRGLWPRSAFGGMFMLFVVMVGIAWTLSLTFDTDPGKAPQADPIDECRSVVLVGLRGSGEGRDADNGYGAVVGPIRNRLAEALGKDVTFADVPVDYPAIAVVSDDWSIVKDTILGTAKDGNFVKGAEVGAKQVASTIQSIHAQCADRSAVVVVGYSQGAMAAHDGVARLPAEDAAIVASLQLVADPWRRERTRDAETGDKHPSAGIARSNLDGAPGPLPKGLATSWCHRSDPVCAADVANAAGAFTTHITHYRTPEATKRVVAAILKDLGR